MRWAQYHPTRGILVNIQRFSGPVIGFILKNGEKSLKVKIKTHTCHSALKATLRVMSASLAQWLVHCSDKPGVEISRCCRNILCSFLFRLICKEDKTAVSLPCLRYLE